VGALRGGALEFEADPISFIETAYGARSCPSGTITVPSSSGCRRYAATVQNQGLCAKKNGYGSDCDGPTAGRASWCAYRPLGCWQSRNGCTYYKESGTDEPQLDVRKVCQIVGQGPPSPDSLYCLSLLATRVDRRLLSMQQREGLGVFACDNYTIFSEDEIELAPGTLTSAIGVNTTCHRGGPSAPYHNVRVFVEVWKRVLAAGRFRDYAWTLKVEADAVFLPARARSALSGIWDPPRGVYVANCREGDRFLLRGPLETFSRNALEVYGRGSSRCLEGSGRLHSHGWNEAVFMDECMKRLGVYRRLDGNFLLEPSCSASSRDTSALEGASVSCNKGKYVAFHPFKQEQAYRGCASTAGWTRAQTRL